VAGPGRIQNGCFEVPNIDKQTIADIPTTPPVGARSDIGDALRIVRFKAHDAAERRQLTLMFCDLVGSTALSARFDLEELREEIRAYQNAVSGIVARYDGFVAKFMGDGMLA